MNNPLYPDEPMRSYAFVFIDAEKKRLNEEIEKIDKEVKELFQRHRDLKTALESLEKVYAK